MKLKETSIGGPLSMGPWLADNIVKILIFPNLIYKFNANRITT